MADKYKNKTVIFIPTLNRPKLLEKTIGNLSLATEKYEDIYLAIFDNNSDDFSSYSFITTLLNNNEKISLTRFEERLPAHANWNRCINLLRNSKYIAFYHDDDLYDIEMPKRQIDFLNKYPNVCIVSTNSVLIDEDDKIIGEWQSKSFGPIVKGEAYIRDVLVYGRNIINCPSVMLRTNLLPDPLFFENLEPNGGDIVTWLKMALKHDVGFIDDKLMQYRKHSNAETSKTLPIKAIKDTFNAFQFFMTEYSLVSDFVKKNSKLYKWIILNRYSFQIIKQLIKFSIISKDKANFLIGYEFLIKTIPKFSFWRVPMVCLRILLNLRVKFNFV
ncbi:MAG: glycosyltransferase [Saprospiraceae bacterium]